MYKLNKKNNMEEKKINLKNLYITTLEGNKETLDISKEVANIMFRNAKTIVVHEASIALHNTGECTYSVEVQEMILAISKEYYPFFIQLAVEELFK